MNPTQTHVVVVVDDDDNLRNLLCMLLDIGPHVTCRSMASLEELMDARAEVLAADLIVLDVNLGADVPSGIDAHAWLQQQGYQGRVVFLTGHAASHPLVRQAIAMGKVEVLQKPVEPETLMSLLESAD